jgi:hypothetical protein
MVDQLQQGLTVVRAETKAKLIAAACLAVEEAGVLVATVQLVAAEEVKIVKAVLALVEEAAAVEVETVMSQQGLDLVEVV